MNKKGISLVGWMMIAVVAGFVVGFGLLLFKQAIGEDSELWNTIYQLLFVDITSEEGLSGLGLFYDIQQLFLAALQLGIVPVVLTSLVLAIIDVTDTAKLGRMAARSLGLFVFFYLLCEALAIVFAFGVKATGLFNVTLPEGVAEVTPADPYNPLTIVLDIVPNNLAGTLADNGSVLSIMFIGFVMGIIMQHNPKKTEPLAELLRSVKHVVEVYLNFIIAKISPVAIFCMIARAFAIYGLEYIMPTASYIAFGCIAGIAVYLIVYPASIAIATRQNPVIFLKKTLKMALITAATTSSSAGLPSNLEAAKDLGCPDEISSFVLPTGCIISMPGTAVMQTMAVMFIATSAGIDVQWFQMLIAAGVIVITAIATPTVPMAGTILIYVALSAVGFTSDMCLLAYALVVAINYPVGMACIINNTVGDAAVNVIVSKLEGQLDEDQYNA